MNQRQLVSLFVRHLALVCAVLSATSIVLIAVAARANTIVDLRFDPSDPGYNAATPKLIISPASGDYLIQVWAQVYGTNTLSTDDGINRVHGSIQSVQLAGGALAGGAGVGVTGTGVPNSFWTIQAPFGVPGTAQNITTDSVQDWGTAGPVNFTTMVKFNDSSPIDSVFTTTAGLPAGSFNTLPAGTDVLGNTETGVGAEFYVGTITFHVGSLSNILGSATDISWVKGIQNGIVPAYGASVDSNAPAQNSTADANYLNSSTSPATLASATDVTFEILPEPSTIILAACGAIGTMLVGRRKHLI